MKLYLKRYFPDNSDKTLNFWKENQTTTINIKTNLLVHHGRNCLQVVTIDEKKYIHSTIGNVLRVGVCFFQDNHR